MGQINQLAEFSPDIAAIAQPLRPLMSPKRSFIWTPDDDQVFENVKKTFTTCLGTPRPCHPSNRRIPSMAKAMPFRIMVKDGYIYVSVNPGS